MTTHRRRRHLLPSLDALTDAQLHAVLGRVQTLLLNRPQSGTQLAVDLLTADEARLLTLYRALPRLLRRALLAVVEQSFTYRERPGHAHPQDARQKTERAHSRLT